MAEFTMSRAEKYSLSNSNPGWVWLAVTIVFGLLAFAVEFVLRSVLGIPFSGLTDISTVPILVLGVLGAVWIDLHMENYSETPYVPGPLLNPAFMVLFVAAVVSFTLGIVFRLSPPSHFALGNWFYAEVSVILCSLLTAANVKGEMVQHGLSQNDEQPPAHG